MIEILKVIVMVCNINNGRLDLGYIESNANKCRKHLIKCVDNKSTLKYATDEDKLKVCLMEME